MTTNHIQTCQLCRQQKQLASSHIIPKFIGDWIKDTSVTGKLRTAETPNHRVQDLTKTKFLCFNCENNISLYEKYFSETFFKPFLNSNAPKIEYDERLKKFVISILWRILVFTTFHIDWKNAEHDIAARDTEEAWRDYLTRYEILQDHYLYLLMLKLVPEAELIPETNVDINWYFFRSVDGTIAQNEDEAFIYVKIPGFAFFSSVYLHPLPFFKGCRVLDKGFFDFNSQNIDLTLFKFLDQRSVTALSPIGKMSNLQKDTIRKDYDKYKDKINSSFGFHMFMAKEFRKKL